MSGNGWVCVHRSLLDHYLWEDKPFSKGQAWIDLVLLANHEDKKMLFDGQVITIKRGQHLTSIRKLAERWGWGRHKISIFLKLLENDKMANIKRDTHCTLITLVNYSVYQDLENEKGTRTGHGGDTVGTRWDTNNNDNNDNNRDIYNAHFEEFWKIYVKKRDKAQAYKQYQARLKNGYSEEELLTACKNYMAECKKQHTETRYIKDAKTFLGVNTPFVDFLPKKQQGKPDREYEDGLMLFDLEYGNEAPPFYGLPEEWFENGKLIENRVTAIRQIPRPDRGCYESDFRDKSKERIMEIYKIRKEFYEREANSG